MCRNNPLAVVWLCCYNTLAALYSLPPFTLPPPSPLSVHSPSGFWVIVVMGRSGRKNALTQPESSFCDVKYQFTLLPIISPIPHAHMLTQPIHLYSIHSYKCLRYPSPLPAVFLCSLWFLFCAQCILVSYLPHPLPCFLSLSLALLFSVDRLISQ